MLNGASLSLSNQQVITAQGGTAPGFQSVPCNLVPCNRRTLLKAQGSEGTETWIYRFGDGDTAGESVALDAPIIYCSCSDSLSYCVHKIVNK